ncbi:tetratricopeptide repeat protein [bacterium]|nr:tetratricopeptide repeat protein [bacterium]
MRILTGRSAAITLFVLLVFVFAGCQSTHVRSAKIYMQQGDPENAKEVLLEGAEATPNDPELWYVLGKVYAELEEWDQMDSAFKKAEELSSTFDGDIENTRYENWRLKYNAAVAPFNEGNYEGAIEILQTALVIKPGDQETHKRLGLCYLQTDNFDLAEKHLKAAIEGEGEERDISSRRNLLLLYWQKEQFADVIDISDELLAMPEMQGDLDEARAEMRSDTIQKKALALQQLDRVDEAIATWEDAIESDPANPDFYFNKAILLHSLERFDDAGTAYLKAIELNPSDNDARLNAARAMLGAEKYQTIIDILMPWLFPDGTVTPDVVVVNSMDPYMLLRAAEINLGFEKEADALAKILVELQQQEN